MYEKVILMLSVLFFFRKRFLCAGEIVNPDDKILVARGGMGGVRATRFLPARGQRKILYLDLKLIADVGFVGLVLAF